MMINPPVDKLIDKIGCKYALVCLVAKRSRYLLEKKSDLIGTSSARAVNYAAHEIYEGRVRIVED